MTRKTRVKVRGPEGSRPFLRGMLTHSLLKLGLNFKEAFAVAKAVRQCLPEKAGRANQDVEVTTDELVEFVREVIVDMYGKARAREIEEHQAPYEDPLIVHPEGIIPFSRGLLSQKLIRTGLEPGNAYEVAHDVWLRLRERTGNTVTVEDLNRLERQSVVKRHGEDFGNRYDAIERIASSDRPIVVLIGGASGVGKSTLATEIAYRLGIRSVASTDMIREIMRKLLSPDILPSLHSSSFEFSAHHMQNDPIVNGFLLQGMRVEVGIAAAIRRAILERFHMIIEGVHVVAPIEFAKQFEKDTLIVPVILATLDRAVLESRFIRRGKEMGSQRHAKRYLRSLDNIMRIQDHILEQADQHDVPIIENVSFDEAANDLLRLITDRIHGIGELVGSKS